MSVVVEQAIIELRKAAEDTGGVDNIDVDRSRGSWVRIVIQFKPLKYLAETWDGIYLRFDLQPSGEDQLYCDEVHFWQEENGWGDEHPHNMGDHICWDGSRRFRQLIRAGSYQAALMHVINHILTVTGEGHWREGLSVCQEPGCNAYPTSYSRNFCRRHEPDCVHCGKGAYDKSDWDDDGSPCCPECARYIACYRCGDTWRVWQATTTHLWLSGFVRTRYFCDTCKHNVKECACGLSFTDGGEECLRCRETKEREAQREVNNDGQEKEKEVVGIPKRRPDRLHITIDPEWSRTHTGTWTDGWRYVVQEDTDWSGRFRAIWTTQGEPIYVLNDDGSQAGVQREDPGVSGESD